MVVVQNTVCAFQIWLSIAYCAHMNNFVVHENIILFILLLLFILMIKMKFWTKLKIGLFMYVSNKVMIGRYEANDVQCMQCIFNIMNTTLINIYIWLDLFFIFLPSRTSQIKYLKISVAQENGQHSQIILK